MSGAALNPALRPHRLTDAAPELERLLTRGADSSPLFTVEQIRCKTVMVTMRDGIRLATDLYLPPVLPAPAIAMRTPYGRAWDRFVGSFIYLARRGYVVVSQDVRGTGDSEPDSWDYYLYEPEDGHDFVEWVGRQDWFDGFLGGCGGSYLGQTQWCMARHPGMSAILPEVSNLGMTIDVAHHHMYRNAYARSVGKGSDKVAVSLEELERQMLEETLATGYFNEPLHQPFSAALLARYPELRTLPPLAAKRRLWEQYCALSCAERTAFVKQTLGTNSVTAVDIQALSAIFGNQVPHDAHTLPHPQPAELCRQFQAPVLLRTGWYDWYLNDTLATWELFKREAQEHIAARSRLLITPSAHNKPGYHEGMAEHRELQHSHSVLDNSRELLLRWYAAVREGTTSSWPNVIYYLMGANEWQVASAWPPPEVRTVSLYLGAGGALTAQLPQQPQDPDDYTYDPEVPTPTLGGSICSHVYTPGSVDVSDVQRRPDVLVYTTVPLERDLDVVGPLKLILYASSSAIDTDFVARLTDVFPDGRAIQLQNGVLRARCRDLQGEPQLLEPGRIYRLEIDMWATANRFKAGHRLRLDISSADFPRFDRNANRGGEPGPPLSAVQTIYRDPQHPSHLLLPVLGDHCMRG